MWQEGCGDRVDRPMRSLSKREASIEEVFTKEND